ncbi:hypothetical protein GO988_04940 [Hymenobacter sp. HMF4947]|uniref:Uncharacterized protein n=1 Tax=Hymenobacter ginkgonis TaxID=2682976 RepID=A0A7K1TB91_9BACT|nr:hypothetical protein [Hymenobacter ginkgonis]MVN75667.1 hypothetical protein [Hymenobacter ginkgonis]
MDHILRLKLLAGLLLAAGSAAAQTGSVGIGVAAPNSSAVLELASGTTTPKGFLPPRMTKTVRDAISSPAEGLVIYQTDNTPGLYQRVGSVWASLGTLNTESMATAPAPTTNIPLVPAATTFVYSDNNNTAANGTVTLGTGVEGQRLVVVNNDAQFLPVVSASGTGNVLPKYAARFIYTASGWRRES